MNNNETTQNGFAHLILLFALVVVGVVGYFVYQNNLFNQNGEKISQPTPTPESTVEDEKNQELLSPTPDPTADWGIYTNEDYGFSLKFPPELDLDIYNNNIGFIGEKIFFTISENDPENCSGDCPIINKTSSVIVAGIPATKLEGWVGEIGGTVAQYYIGYIFRVESKYLMFRLNARDRNEREPGPDGGIWEIDPNDMAVFDKILSTFEFTE